MEAKTITDYLSEADAKPDAPLQGFVAKPLRDKVLAQMKKDKQNGRKITWNALMKAMCLAYLSEREQENAAKA